MDDVDDLKAKGRFGDVVLICWGHVEMYLGLLMSYEIFGMYNDTWLDDGWELLHELPIDWRLRLLRMKGTLFEKEYQCIKKFQVTRNKKLFHLYGDQQLDSRDRDLIMDEAIQAARAAEWAYHEVVERGRPPESRPSEESET